MPDVILINPPMPGSSPNTRAPLGLLHLAAVLLENMISVEILDETVQEDSRELLLRYLKTDPVCVGITTLSGTMLLGALDVARFVRRHRPEVPIVWGGVHTTLAPMSTLSHELVDAICIGEGEVSFVDMVKVYREGRSLSHVHGIGYKEDGKPVLTEPRKEYYDLNQLPPLPYRLVDLDLYKPLPFGEFFGFESQRRITLEFSRGCPYRCTYCVVSVKREPFRSMSSETAVRFMEQAVHQGAGAITIADDNLFSNPKNAVRIMQAIREKKWSLDISVSVRSDDLKRVNDDTIALMREIGIRIFTIGVESGSNNVLKNIINKGETIETTFEVNRRLARMGIHAWFHFIVGFPGETLDDIIQTYGAITRILKENPYGKVSVKKLIPTPNTPIFHQCVAGGMFSPKTIEDWSRIEDLGWQEHASYVDPEVERWFWSTRYYATTLRHLSDVRNPYSSNAQKVDRFLTTLIFWLFSWVIALRSKLGVSGFFLDNLFILPLRYLLRSYLSLKSNLPAALLIRKRAKEARKGSITACD